MLMILQCIFLIFFSTILDVRHFHIRLKIRDASMWDKGGYFRVDDRGERRKEENKKVTPRQCQSGKR